MGTIEAFTGERAAGAAVSTVLIASGRPLTGLATSGVPLPEFIDASAANQAGRQEPSRGLEPESGLFESVDSSVPQSVTGPSCDNEAIADAGL